VAFNESATHMTIQIGHVLRENCSNYLIARMAYMS
jgi:hypothetical protein